MRRLLLLALAALACAVAAGCGGGEDESSGPLDATLAYLPAETPFAAAIDTDLDGDQYKAVDELLAKFPLGIESVEDILNAVKISSDKESVKVDLQLTKEMLDKAGKNPR